LGDWFVIGDLLFSDLFAIFDLFVILLFNGDLPFGDLALCDSIALRDAVLRSVDPVGLHRPK
jgi:hypothetical protein